jgi:phosphoribosyl-AMP cyclohydrolase
MEQPDFAKMNGLIPTIVQEYETGDVLMMAYMNKEAWETTLNTGKATFWSRSRKELWVKGLTSGHTQLVKSVFIDCDNDTILLKVDQIGGIACHTGKRSCFYK